MISPVLALKAVPKPRHRAAWYLPIDTRTSWVFPLSCRGHVRRFLLWGSGRRCQLSCCFVCGLEVHHWSDKYLQAQNHWFVCPVTQTTLDRQDSKTCLLGLAQCAENSTCNSNTIVASWQTCYQHHVYMKLQLTFCLCYKLCLSAQLLSWALFFALGRSILQPAPLPPHKKKTLQKQTSKQTKKSPQNQTNNKKQLSKATLTQPFTNSYKLFEIIAF